MKKNKKMENIDLIVDEVVKPIDKALFIVSYVYYCIRYFYRDNNINSTRKEFQKYLSSFKNKFHNTSISTKFTFDLLNKSSSFDNSIDNTDKNIDNLSQGGKTKEEIYYDLLYKRLINIINEEMYYNKEEYKIKKINNIHQIKCNNLK